MTNAAIAVPTLAPSSTAKAIGRPIRAWPANEESSSVVAVELCRISVTTAPLAIAETRLPVKRAIACRSDDPNARVAPVRTSRTAQISSATAPARWIRMAVVLSAAFIVGRALLRRESERSNDRLCRQIR